MCSDVKNILGNVSKTRIAFTRHWNAFRTRFRSWIVSKSCWYCSSGKTYQQKLFQNPQKDNGLTYNSFSKRYRYVVRNILTLPLNSKSMVYLIHLFILVVPRSTDTTFHSCSLWCSRIINGFINFQIRITLPRFYLYRWQRVAANKKVTEPMLPSGKLMSLRSPSVLLKPLQNICHRWSRLFSGCRRNHNPVFPHSMT